MCILLRIFLYLVHMRVGTTEERLFVFLCLRDSSDQGSSDESSREEQHETVLHHWEELYSSPSSSSSGPPTHCSLLFSALQRKAQCLERLCSAESALCWQKI